MVAAGNEPLFERIANEVSLEVFRYPSGDEYNGWLVPDDWSVQRATIAAMARSSSTGWRTRSAWPATHGRSPASSIWDELAPHLVTNADLPDAYMFHCMWQYRPWDADWALSVPYETYATLGAGRYEVDLQTTYAPGEMLIGHHDVPGRTDRTIVFHSNTCHPHQANDGFAGHRGADPAHAVAGRSATTTTPTGSSSGPSTSARSSTCATTRLSSCSGSSAACSPRCPAPRAR